MRHIFDRSSERESMKDKIEMQDVLQFLQKENEKNIAAAERVKTEKVSQRGIAVTNSMGKNRKYLRYKEATAYYGIGLSTLRVIAREAGAMVKIRKIALIDTDKMNRYLDSFREEAY